MLAHQRKDFIDATTKPKLKLTKVSDTMGDSDLERMVAKAGTLSSIIEH